MRQKSAKLSRKAIPRSSRFIVFLTVAALLGIPAAAARVLCLGKACAVQATSESKAPFCSLPPSLRTSIANGFYEGRSPELIAVAGSEPVRGSVPPAGAAYLVPGISASSDDEAPIVFFGSGVVGSGAIADPVSLDDIAPTIASIIGLERPHPEVRSGTAIGGVSKGDRPRLVIQVIWKGIGSADLSDDPGAWPVLKNALAEGAGTLAGGVGSLPADPAAVVTTIGSGAVPSQHGITGASIRAESGRLTKAWSKGAPDTVIATLGDDLDELLDQEPLIGLVANERTDRGAIGRDWYGVFGDQDRDSVEILPPDRGPGAVASAAIQEMNRAPYGADETPDLLAVSSSGSVAQLDRALGRLIEAAKDEEVAFVVAGTGSLGPSSSGAVEAREVVDELEGQVEVSEAVIEAATPAGFFLDQATLVDTGTSADSLLGELLELRNPAGGALFVDAFPDRAITFGEYC
jgi:hypothetical protein